MPKAAITDEQLRLSKELQPVMEDMEALGVLLGQSKRLDAPATWALGRVAERASTALSEALDGVGRQKGGGA